jgi:hypothetical protein
MSCGCQLTKVSFGEEFHNWLLDNSESVFEHQLPFDGSGLGVVPVVSLAPACKTIFSDGAVAAAIEESFATFARDEASSRASPMGTASSTPGRFELDTLADCRETLGRVLGFSNRHTITAGFRLVQSYLRLNDVCVWGTARVCVTLVQHCVVCPGGSAGQGRRYRCHHSL